MEEYEYSFKVKDLKPYYEYCDNNGFTLVSSNNQTRDLYIGKENILARITKTSDNIILDFKYGDNSSEILHIRKESIPLEIKEKDLDAVLSIIDVLGYKQIEHLIRKRIVYEKGDVRFEIDEYTKPEIMMVVAIEGLKEEVDRVYDELKEINDKEQLHERL